MKNLRKLSLVVGIFFITAILFLTGCKKEHSVVTKQEVSSNTIISDPDVLKELQFMRDEKIITSENYEKFIRMDNVPLKYESDVSRQYYRYCPESECDELLSRKMIQEMMVEKELQGNLKYHRRNVNMYSSSGGVIVLRVKTSGSPCTPVPSLWQVAITQAVAEWNALGYNVTFSTTTTSSCTNVLGYVNIEMGNTGLGSSNIAAAEKPQSPGTFGAYIRINTAYTGTALTASAKKFTIAHELGHIIGLLHTDTSEGSAVSGSISCSGLPDPNSVFKSVIPYNQSWSGFTVCDKAVLNFYW